MATELVAIPLSQYEHLRSAFVKPEDPEKVDELVKEKDEPKEPELKGPKIPRSIWILVENSVPLESQKQAEILLHNLSQNPRFSVSENGEVGIDGHIIKEAYLWDLLNVYFRNLPSKGVPGMNQFLDLLKSMDAPDSVGPPKSYIDELKEPTLPVEKNAEKKEGKPKKKKKSKTKLQEKTNSTEKADSSGPKSWTDAPRLKKLRRLQKEAEVYTGYEKRKERTPRRKLRGRGFEKKRKKNLLQGSGGKWLAF